jgi:endonuclease I
LFELYPSDGYVNGLRGNLPFGDVSTARYTSSNGCKIGKCSSPTGDYTGECFEAADVLKGDLARTYFYLSTLYDGVWECCDDTAVNNASIDKWEEDVLREWHAKDSVDDVERKRNDVIYDRFQHNRNPYIDHPEFVGQIEDF